MALPMNTGAEAVETAIKIARKWGYRVKGIPLDRAEIIVCRNNFHGRTTTIVGFSSEPQYRDDFGPYADGFKLIDFGDVEQLRAAITPHTAAFLVEPIQAEAGIIIPPDGYLASRQDALRRQRRPVDSRRDPDRVRADWEAVRVSARSRRQSLTLLVLGKALGGGCYPVSAVVGSRAIMNVLHPGDHGSTFGGNPLAAAIGEASLDVLIEERLAARAAKPREASARQACERSAARSSRRSGAADY